MKSLNVHEAKTQLSKALKAVEEDGEVFLICRSGHPIAELRPHARRSRTRVHPALSKIKVGYDPVEPLSDEDWPSE